MSEKIDKKEQDIEIVWMGGIPCIEALEDIFESYSIDSLIREFNKEE